MLAARLLALSVRLCFSSTAISQNGLSAPVPPNSCPVTKPSEQVFVTLSPYPAKAAPGTFWFGTDELWTVLPVTGSWKLGHYTKDDTTFRQKLPFWRYGYDARTEPRPNLSVKGRRIDHRSPPLVTDEKGNGSWEETADPSL